MKIIIKGMVIGFGKVIPGLSGSVLAINMGVYEYAISCITNFFSNIKENIKFLGLLGIGIIISISIFSRGIYYALDNYYIITMFSFIGLILGTSKFNNNNKYRYISMFSFFIVLLLNFVDINWNISVSNYYGFLYLFLIGIIDAMTMIIPGISGTAILMLLGVYNLILKTYSNIINPILFIDNITVLIPFFMGVLIGVFVTSKIMNYCMMRYYMQTNMAIKGFLYGSVFSMFLSIFNYNYGICDMLIGSIICIIIILFFKRN